MQEKLVSFQVAKLAKEKKFNIHCRWYFDDKDGTLCENEDFPYNSWNNSLFAPTQSLLQRWLREVHRIYVYIKPIHNLDINGSMLDNWEICIEDFMGRKSLEESIYIHGYEEALEVGLQESLKLIKV